MSIRKKENRLWFTINHSTMEDVEGIENYFEEPIQKIILPDVIEIIKKKRATLPAKIMPLMK